MSSRPSQQFSDMLSWVVLVALATGCSNSATQSGGGAASLDTSVTASSDTLEGSVSINGSSTVLLISQAVAEEFGAVHPDVKVDVGATGTGSGMRMFASGEIQICDASRGIKDSEVDACRAAGIEFIELTVAFDGLAVVVNPENDWCESLTVQQLKAIWRPESEDSVLKWSDVNPQWPEEPFKLYGPGDDSGTFDYFTKVINGEEKASRRDYQPSEDDNALVRGVAGDKGGLGYFGYAYYAENTDKLKLVGVDGGSGTVRPNEATVRDNTYAPLSRPLFIYVRKSALAQPEIVEFVKFYIANCASLATDVGYVPVSDEVAAQNEELLAAALP